MADELRRVLSEMEDLDENIISGKPWAEAMMQRACATTKKAVLNWCNFINKIGDADGVDVEKNVSIFEKQVERVYEDLILDIETVHAKHVDKVMQTLAQIQTVCKDLRLEIPNFEFEGVPLSDLHKVLQTRYSEYKVQAQERKDRLYHLHKRLGEVCEALGIAAEFIPDSPLPTDASLDKLRERVEKLESEKMKREEKFAKVKAEIAAIMKELDLKPTLDFERALWSSGDGQVMITDAEMEQLCEFHEKILKQEETIMERFTVLKAKVENLWNILEIHQEEINAFREKHPGYSAGTLEAYESEVRRCMDIRKSCMKRCIDKQRQELSDLWDKCHCSDRDRSDFLEFFESDCYTEDLFELHEREIDKWKRRYEQNVELYQTVTELESMWKRRLDMKMSTAAGTGTDRYKNRGGQLLYEEKMRNMLAKGVLKLEENLVRLAESFRIRHGTEFLTRGRTVEQYLSHLHENFDKEVKIQLSARKMQKEQQLQQSEVGKSRNNLHVTPSMGSNSNLLAATPGSAVTASGSTSKETGKLLETPSTPSTSRQEARMVVVPECTAARLAISASMAASRSLLPKPTSPITARDKRLARKKARSQFKYSLSRTKRPQQEREAAERNAQLAANYYMDFVSDLITPARNKSRSTTIGADVLPETDDESSSQSESPPVSPVKLEDKNNSISPKK